MIEREPGKQKKDFLKINEVLDLVKQHINDNFDQNDREEATQILEDQYFVDEALEALEEMSTLGVEMNVTNMAKILFRMVEEIIKGKKDKTFTPLRKPWMKRDH